MFHPFIYILLTLLSPLNSVLSSLEPSTLPQHKTMELAPPRPHRQYPPNYERATTGYSNTINTRVLTGYPKWGFVIYRGTYKDDILWDKCITLVKINAHQWLLDKDQVNILEPDLEWTIIEDRDTLDGAPKEVV